MRRREGEMLVSEAAKVLKRSRQQVMSYVLSGQIPAYQKQDGRREWELDDAAVRTFVPQPKGNPAWRRSER